MIMLYDGAIRFLNQGIQAIEDKTIDKRSYFINKASAIIAEFAATLDYSHNAELAEDLKALYGYMLKRLMQGNMQNDPEPLQEVRTLLAELRDTWTQAIELNKQHNSSNEKPVDVNQAHASITITL